VRARRLVDALFNRAHTRSSSRDRMLAAFTIGIAVQVFAAMLLLGVVAVTPSLWVHGSLLAAIVIMGTAHYLAPISPWTTVISCPRSRLQSLNDGREDGIP